MMDKLLEHEASHDITEKDIWKTEIILDDDG